MVEKRRQMWCLFGASYAGRDKTYLLSALKIKQIQEFTVQFMQVMKQGKEAKYYWKPQDHMSDAKKTRNQSIAIEYRAASILQTLTK